MNPDEIQEYILALKRERKARKEAEALLESKSLELFRSNAELQMRNETLENLNKQLEAAQSQLLQSEKMASIGQLAAGVAHEINNPISFVTSNVRTLNKYADQLVELISHYKSLHAELPSDNELLLKVNAFHSEIDSDYLCEDVKSLINESMEGLDRVRQIVLDLRDFSRAGERDGWVMAKVEPGLDQTINIVWHELKYKAQLHRDYTGLSEIECQPAKLNQVFLNLLVNACHAINHDHGEIHVGTGQTEGWVWVEVRDNGCGIAPDKVGRIFDPFFTTKPLGQGTGLGLSLSYGIVKKHHGHIEVNSQVGEGTRFRVWLPARQPEPPVTEDPLTQNG